MATGPISMIVSVPMEMTLVLANDSNVQVSATLDYRVDEPYSVRAVFDTIETSVAWVFSRELLAEGISDPAGQGDVTIWPSHEDPNKVCIALSSPNGHALLEVQRSDVNEFLARSYAVLPRGEESSMIDFDHVIAQLLAQE